MRTLIAAIAAIALASPAAAFCYGAPDTAETGYVGNNLARTICLQDELAADTASRIAQTQLNATLDQLQREALQRQLELQRLQAQQLILQNQLLLQNQNLY
ncbi:MAG: hypothetical protein ACO1OG_10505 [Devosia sp.]